MAQRKPCNVRSVRERFEEKIKRVPGGCWIWTATINTKGYGQFRMRNPNRIVGAHRVSYEMYVGPIPDGLVLDHICRRRSCVNPQHLEPVTNGENTRRGVSPSTLTQRFNRCKRGHAMTPGNVIVHRRTGWRRCKTCEYQSQARYRARRRAARAARV